jgi:hypothetical protein
VEHRRPAGADAAGRASGHVRQPDPAPAGGPEGEADRHPLGRDILLHTDPSDDTRGLSGTTAEEAMSPSPISCRLNTTVSWVAETMVTVKIDAVPVVGVDDRLLGIVTSSDLLSLLIGPEEEDQLLPFDFSLRHLDRSGALAVA